MKWVCIEGNSSINIWAIMMSKDTPSGERSDEMSRLN